MGAPMKSVTTARELSTEEFWRDQPDGIYAQISYGDTSQEPGTRQLILKYGGVMLWLRCAEQCKAGLRPVWPFDLNNEGCIYGEWALLEEGDEIDRHD